MYRERRVAVVMPAYNVEHHILRSVRSVPEFVDHLLAIDDGSTDATLAILQDLARPGLEIIRHDQNRGVGAAIGTGYRVALHRGAEIVAVMAGDAQMDPADLPRVLDPLVEDRADYVKGNRFLHGDVWRAMPRARIVGNIVLSTLSKITTGYYRLFDSQCGYTAISRAALRALGGRIFSRYGYVNDLLARLGALGARVVDVRVRPIYADEPSGIRLWTVFHPILAVLAGSMARRLWQRYLRRGLLRKAPRRIGERGPDGEVSLQGAVDNSANDIRRVLILARGQACERRAKCGDIGGGAPESLAYSGEGVWDRPPERLRRGLLGPS